MTYIKIGRTSRNHLEVTPAIRGNTLEVVVLNGEDVRQASATVYVQGDGYQVTGLTQYSMNGSDSNHKRCLEIILRVLPFERASKLINL